MQKNHKHLLSFKNISYTYENSNVLVLKNISFSISRGEYVAIVGPSGSGKSTLMNLIGLLSTSTMGTFELSDKLVSDNLASDESAYLRNKKIGFVFQSFFLLPKLTVLENILLPTKYQVELSQTQAKYKAQNLMKKLGIDNFQDRLPSELSGGQKQRVAICRALILSPDILLADEPTGALDSNTSGEVLAIFENLVKNGQTVIVVTHDNEVANSSRRIIQMKDGEIVSDTFLNSAQVFHETLKQHQIEFETPKNSPINFLKDTFFNFANFISQTMRNLFSQKLRSALTISGLTIGVSSIVIMHSLISETKNVFSSFFDTKGGKQAFLMFDKREADKLGSARWGGMLLGTETEAFQKRFEGEILVDPIVEVENCLVRSFYQETRTSFRGIQSLDIIKKEELKTQLGRIFSPLEFSNPDSSSKSLLIGKELKEKLFPKGRPFEIGERVTLSDCKMTGSFSIIGVLEEQDATFDENANTTGFTTLSAMLASGVSKKVTMFALTPLKNSMTPTLAGETVKNALTLKTENKFPFRFFAPEQQIQKINTMLNIFSVVTVLIGGLCTVIGGVGVMNIVLAGMTERLQEIGLRKAVGATQKNIRNQFLGETFVLCSLAGIIGVFVGVIFSNFILNTAAGFFPKYLSVKFVFNANSIALALFGAIGTGFFFGLYPALYAAKKDIISSLRRE